MSTLPHTTAVCDYCGLPMKVASASGRQYCCHGCRFAAGITSTDDTSDHLAGPATALGLSVFFTMNVVMLTMALWSYPDPSHASFEQSLRDFLRYGAMVFSLLVLFLLGRPLMSHAISRLQAGVFTSDLLLATGVIAAYTLSVVNTLRGEGHVYFEVGCVILVLVTVGRWLEAAGRSRASSALDGLERLLPDSVRRITADGETQQPRSEARIGDVIRVLAGERIPLDGRLRRGHGVIDEQFFTGESAPAEKRPGESVLGGSLNLDGELIIEVTAPPNGGALGRLVAAVREARLSKGYYQRLSDSWSQWFFPIISLIAMASFFWQGLSGDWEHGLFSAMSVVLIACPCALALATPLAIWTALSAAASKGVLCRSGAALEKMATLRALRWDKTGTLTTGSPRVNRFVAEDPAELTSVMNLALMLAGSSNHPYSQAILAFGKEFLMAEATRLDGGQFEGPVDHQSQERQSVAIPQALDFIVKTIAGRGLRATTTQGKALVLGSARWMDENKLQWGPRLSALMIDSSTCDQPVVAVGSQGTVKGLFLLEETIRPEARAVVAELRTTGLDQAVLTGDRHARAEAFSRSVGLSVEFELLPEQKLDAIRRAHEIIGPAAMIGDGLNDAPALAAADVGIALGCGADVSRDSADICVLSSDLRLIPWTSELSRRTVRTIRTNLIWAFGYNGLGVLFAATGHLHPALAAGLMVVSSLMVLGNSLRLSVNGVDDSAADGEVQKRSTTSGRGAISESQCLEIQP